MERIVEKITPTIPSRPKATRVAAYARVSNGKDAMLHSLSAQVSYYSKTIQEHPGWLYCGVYSDEAITGTKEQRNGFQQMYADCKAGKIDMVITKSISRFARNTVTLLETVRELKLFGVDVYFEEQNIHTMSADGELMLTLLASFAQEESLSVSENMKWRVKKNFEQGIPWRAMMLGYRLVGDKYEIIEEEAKIVRYVYAEYLSGKGYDTIAKELNESGVPSKCGGPWGHSEILKIISNSNYTGNLILQKTYIENHITKRSRINKGELPKYYIENSHDAIIPMETFIAVQEERERRMLKYLKKPVPKKKYPFSGLLVCDICGKNYRRKTTATGIVWICSTFNVHGKARCASKQIPETTLEQVTAEVLDTTEFIADSVSNISDILVSNGNLLTFRLVNGTEVKKHWKDRSRSESWTPEMREAAAQKTSQRYKEERKCNSGQ